MAVTKKTLFAENLDRYNTFVQDTNPNSRYFNITELPDTFTGGKNAFLIAGSNELVADTLIKIEIKDAAGEIIYHEPGEGYLLTNINGESFPIEYYEGVSKVVAVYIYPDTTAYGPCTITILGELSNYYDDNGLLSPIPLEWQGTYNVKWQKKVNVNPTLANTTKVRFYRRPSVSITENLESIYRIENGIKVNSGISQSFANVTVSNINTFAGDVKRVKVYRTSEGDISDYDLIQDILVESKELLTSYELSGSVISSAGFFTSEVLSKLWTASPGMNVSLDSTKIDNGIKLRSTDDTANFRYTSSLNLSAQSVYEFGIDAFYTSSLINDDSNLNIYLSGSNNGEVLVGSLNGIYPTKNLKDQTITFSLDKSEPSASLYLKMPNGAYNEWHVGNITLKLSEDTAFSPDEVSFITSMPTVIGNETYNFKFEFYDVNNNYVPVAVTASATFTGGNDNIGGTLIYISSSASSSLAQLNAVSSSISGTMTVYSSSASGSILNLSSSVSTSVLLLTGSISSSLSSSIGYASGSIYTLSGSISSSITTLSSSLSQSVYQGLLTSFNKVQDLANGNYSGSYISGNIIYAPVIGGQLGYFSTLFKVGQSPNSIYLDARQTPRKIFIGGAVPGGGDTEYSGAYNNTNTSVYLDSSGQFSLGNKLSYNGTNLEVNGTINVTGGNAATQTYANTIGTNAVASGSTSAAAAQTAAQLFATSIGNNAVLSGSSAASAAQTAAINQAKTDASASVNLLANGNWTGGTGTFITATSISSPIIAGNGGYISSVFRVGNNGITLDGVNKKIFVGTGTYNNSNTPFYFASGSTDIFSLGNKLTWDGTTLGITGNITVSGGNAATTTQVSTAQTTADNAATAASNAQTTANGKISAGGAASDVNSNTTTISGGKIRTGIIESTGYAYSSGNFSTTGTQINLDNGLIRSKNFSIDSSGNAFFKGDISGASGTFSGTLSGATITGTSISGGSIQVGTIGSGGVVINGIDFQDRLDDTENDNSISIGPGGIIIKGEHRPDQSLPTNYISLRQQGSYSRVIIQACSNTEPLSVLGFASGNNSSAVNVYNGGLQVRNYSTTAYGYDYLGNGNGGYAIQCFGNQYVYGTLTATGTITANASDARLKTNIRNIDSPLEKISKINGVYFNWNEKAKEIADKDTEIIEVGCIAQEVNEILPEVVKPAPFDIEMDESITDKVVYKSKTGEDYLTIQYERIVPLLVECIKELKAEIEELKKNK